MWDTPVTRSNYSSKNTYYYLFTFKILYLKFSFVNQFFSFFFLTENHFTHFRGIKLKHLIRLLFLFPLCFLGCNDSAIQPVTSKDPHNFNWTVDTLHYPGSMQTMMSSVWGTSPTNVYTCGHNFRNYGQLWHYDGVSWKDIDPSPVIKGSYDLSCVYGFNTNDVWTVGSRLKTASSSSILNFPLIMRFDGNK